LSFKKTLILSITLLLSLSSCSKYIGYGIIMVPGEEADQQFNSLIKITKESRIRDTWVYNTPTEDHIEIDKWRVEFYDTEDETISPINKYAEYKNYYTIVNRNSHNMRSNPFADSPLVYKLKKDQRVKIIGRTDEKVAIGKSFNGYWYQLITDDGVKGWSYDSYLTIYNGDEIIHSNVNSDGPEIHDFFKNNWRPIYFKDMIDSRNINLDKFKQKFKLSPDIDSKEITISMPDNYVTKKFTEAKQTGTYNYILEGSGVLLDFSRKGSVYVTYSVDLKSYVKEFVKMDDAVVTNVIDAERYKRKIRYNEFVTSGPTYNSRAYGTIEFLEDNNFIWTNKENLVAKQLLTNNAEKNGTVNFKIFIKNSLKASYDGAVTFNFGDRQELTFLYSLSHGDLRLLYVPDNRIVKNSINTDDFYTPIQLYFTGQE